MKKINKLKKKKNKWIIKKGGNTVKNKNSTNKYPINNYINNIINDTKEIPDKSRGNNHARKEVKDGFGSGHSRILLVNNVNGAAGGKRLTQHWINVGDSCFTTFESTAKGSGGGGASAAANGGKLGGYTIAGGSFGAEHGTPGDFPGGGGGAGKGPSGLGGDGGAGGAAWFGIIY